LSSHGREAVENTADSKHEARRADIGEEFVAA